MTLLFALSHHESVIVAEVAFLLMVIAGIWVAVAWIQPAKFQRLRMIVAGVLLAAAGMLLIIVVHWGQLG